MALHLLLKWKPNSHSLKNPSLLHFFSTSDSKDKPQTPAATSGDLDVSSALEPATTIRPQPSIPEFLSKLRGNLKNPEQQQSQSNLQSFQFRRSSSPSSTSTNMPYNKSSPNLEEIRNRLSKFRHPSSVPPADSIYESPSLTHQLQEISFLELHNRDVSRKSNVSTRNAEMTSRQVGGAPSYDIIRESLRKSAFGAHNKRRNVTVDQMSLSLVQNSFKSDVGQDSKVVGGKDTLPISIFAKEMMETKEGEKSEATKTELLGMYTFERLGELLRELRPAMKEGNWFSIKELSERLSRLKEKEKKVGSTIIAAELRKTIFSIGDIPNGKPKKSSLQKFTIHGLGQMGRTPDFMLKPPKEHLVEKYFHPDNMSSAEKLKIELAKVREDFKMSESDCGSARVQVAQLTTKIKHLSSVLHKKDKHSRKGLEEMVQRRKKLLKYLRRTDWDSYCFVISKLGLRDNPISKA